MKRLDLRDLFTLHREAQVSLLEKSLDRISTGRVSIAKDEDYKSVLAQLKQSIIEIRMGKTEAVKENWAELKKRGTHGV